MAAFVLVHGSTQNARGWTRVASALTHRGHLVAVPDLPKQAPDWKHEDYAAEIARSITDPATIVVAHSLGGSFLPFVPYARPCALLVFVAAVIPEPGKSFRDQLTEDPTMLAPEWIAAGPRWLDPSQQNELAQEFLFHDCEEESVEWALSTIQLLDTQHLFAQPITLSAWPAVPSVSIVGARDRTLSPVWSRNASRRVLGVEPLEMDTGHCPHVSRPQAVADILEHLAAHHIG